MRLFDIFIPYNICEDVDVMEVSSVMDGFSDYLLEVYKKVIDDNLNKAGRYKQYEKKYGKYLSEYAESKGYSKDIKISGSLIVDSMVKKESREGILLTISSTKRPKGSRIPIDQFVRMVEYGSSKFPALNVLRRANREVNGNIRRYYEEYRRKSTDRSRRRSN